MKLAADLVLVGVVVLAMAVVVYEIASLVRRVWRSFE